MWGLISLLGCRCLRLGPPYHHITRTPDMHLICSWVAALASTRCSVRHCPTPHLYCGLTGHVLLLCPSCPRALCLLTQLPTPPQTVHRQGPCSNSCAAA
jgi:hypothetical protein